MKTHQSAQTKSKSRSGKQRVILALAIAFSLHLIWCYSAIATQFHSGETYSFSTESPIAGQTYAYHWSASDGHSADYTSRVFNWTAPDVDTPKNVTIEVNVTNGLCWGTNELLLTIYPKPTGQISLEKLGGDQNDVKLGATISYIVKITNTGKTNVVHLPLADYYPLEFLKPISSFPLWNEDNGTALSWNELLDKPLAPGESVNLSISFRAIAITNQMVTNFIRAEGVKDDKGSTLEPQEADNFIAKITLECPRLGPDAACVGEDVHFSALQGLPSYEWKAVDDQGNMVGGFNDSTKANVTWKPTSSGVFEISFNDLMCKDRITVRQCNSSIRINKNCDHTDPVHVGQMVTYIYNITNTGELPLTDVKVTDVQDWGPDCQPLYVKGDDGDQVLDPGEVWVFESQYTVPDPSNYTKLYIMASEGDSAKIEALYRRLKDMQTRLEIDIENLKPMVQQFNTGSATLIVDHSILDGIHFTINKYTNVVTGESLSKVVDPQGKLNKTIYVDPILDAVLTTQYDPGGKIISDELDIARNKEHLGIQYDVPSLGYKTLRTTDHNTGDTLILVVDAEGKILSKEFSKTPGFKPYEEKIFLRNTATVTARSPDGKTVSDLDSFTLEIFRLLPSLTISKTAEPDTVMPAGTLNYTISYGNKGSEGAHEVVIRENYDTKLEFLSADPVPDPGTTNRWTLGDLKKGESGVIRIRTLVKSSASPGQQIINRADLTCRENVSASASINTIVSGSGLKITKTAMPDILGPGERFTYTIAYWNDGTERQSNATIHDYLDENVVFGTAWPIQTGKSCRHYWWDVGDLEPGQRGTITIQSAVSESLRANYIYNNYKITSLQSEGKNATLETGIIHSLWIKKTADKSTCNQDEDITYNISFGNEDSNGLKAIDVSVTDILPDVDLLSASPAPDSVRGNILGWNIGELKAGESRSIILVVHVPKKADVRFNEESSVQGEGYIRVSKRLSTAEKDTALVNRANISGIYRGIDSTYSSDASSSAAVTIAGAAGTKVSTSEHGSGYYEENARSSLELQSRSINLEKSLFAKHRKTSFSLPNKRSIDYGSLWSERSTAENRVLNDTVSENYLYSDTLRKNSSIQMDRNQSVYKSESDFSNGIAHISYKKHMQDSTKTTQEISEDYHGSFKVLMSVDSYGDSVKYDKSSQGKGFVSSDNRASMQQRSFEHGSGYYNSEESSQLGSIVKNSKMLYSPVSLKADSRNLSYTNLWGEGMWTKDPETGLIISEEFRYAPYIDKVSGMERSSLSLMGEFNGTMNIELAKGSSPKKESHYLDQSFEGNFKIETAISVYASPKHLYPHLSVSKKAIMAGEDTILFLINVTNDGNQPLEPVKVSDFMPDGLAFINSSIRPEIEEQIINWHIPSLDVSRTITIKLMAEVKNNSYPLINRVGVQAQYQDRILTANNSTKVDLDYLSCCPSIGQSTNLTGIFEANKIQGSWDDWKPSSCFNLTSETKDCFEQMEDYYSALDKAACLTDCASPYEVP